MLISTHELYEAEALFDHAMFLDAGRVVLSGDASVAFDDGSPTIDLRPGSLVRLHAGQRTTWTVRETLRKVFVA